MIFGVLSVLAAAVLVGVDQLIKRWGHGGTAAQNGHDADPRRAGAALLSP